MRIEQLELRIYQSIGNALRIHFRLRPIPNYRINGLQVYEPNDYYTVSTNLKPKYIPRMKCQQLLISRLLPNTRLGYLVSYRGLAYAQRGRKPALPKASENATAIEIPKLMYQYEKAKCGQLLLPYYSCWASTLLMYTQPLSPRQISDLLFGLKSVRRDAMEPILSLVSAISPTTLRCKGLFSKIDIGAACMGLKNLSSEYAPVRELLTILTTKITASRDVLNAQASANALYGLQSMSSEHAEVRILLSALAAKIAMTTEPFKGQEIGTALYGLKGMTSNHAEVRVCVGILAEKIIGCTDILNTQVIGNALYGLQGMSCEFVEVKAVIKAMADGIAVSRDTLDAQAIGNLLYGLQSMSSTSPEVRNLLKTLVPKISHSSDHLTTQHISNALYGLKNMHSDCEEVRAILSVIATKISVCKGTFSAKEMSNALFGMQGMNDVYVEVRTILKRLHDKIEMNNIRLDPQGVGMAEYGLKLMIQGSDEVCGLRKWIESHGKYTKKVIAKSK